MGKCISKLPFNVHSSKGTTESVKTLRDNKKLSSNKAAHRCKYCGKTFKKLSTLRFHSCSNMGNKRHKFNVYRTSFKKGTVVNVHSKLSEEKRHKCYFREKHFSKKRQLTRHEKIHMEKPYTCNICCKSFIYRSRLNTHLRTHLQEKPHTCGFCEKQFTTKPHKIRHE